MLESPQTGSRDVLEQYGGSIFELASESVADLRLSPDKGPFEIDVALCAALYDASLSDEPTAFAPVLAAFRAASISDLQIADHYLPAVARQLGADWSDDQRSFSQVTIGVARLQRVLLELGPEWSSELDAATDGPTVLLLVGANIDHTFGARLVLGQLRRKGVSVRMVIGIEPAEIGALLRKYRFDAVLISSSMGDQTEPLRLMVNAIRATRGRIPPIVIGGTNCATSIDIKGITGADLVTSDLDQALHHCGLQQSQPRSPALSKLGRGMIARHKRGRQK